MDHTNAKQLFVVRHRTNRMFSKADDRPVYEGYMTQDTIDNYRKHECCAVEVLEVSPSPRHWPDGVVVEETKRSSGRCYSEVHYAVNSPRELAEDDFEILRAQDCFMGGQYCGRVLGAPNVSPDGIHTYHLESVCDSSD